MTIERVEPGTADWAEWSAEHLSRHGVAAEHAAGKRVLDAGTGFGYGAAILLAAGAKSVQAVDIDPHTITGATERFAGAIDFFVDDCETLAKVRGPVDLVCSFENIEHLKRPEAFVASAAKLLGDDGVLLCSTPDRAATAPFENGKPVNPFHCHEWYRDEFAALLSTHFRHVDMRVQVMSAALRRRAEAVLTLQRALSLIWRDPSVRLTRGVAKMMGKGRDELDVTALAASAPSDFPVVHASVAALFGAPLCHFAICTGPIH